MNTQATFIIGDIDENNMLNGAGLKYARNPSRKHKNRNYEPI
jgi:hypothetical protein